jgi:TetR/AcrR family tetracycline transcriptional repressor
MAAVTRERGRGRAAARRGRGDSERRARADSGRAALSREAILRAALDVTDREGLEGLTLRKIAAALGASPMGVYRHFRNKAEILGELVDLVIGLYDVTHHDGDPEAAWEPWVRETFCAMRRALLAHPAIIPLLGAAAVEGKNALVVMEEVLAVLRAAGFGRAAAPIFHTLMSYTIGAAAIESSMLARASRGEGGDDVEPLRRLRLLFELAPRDRYPHVVESSGQLAGFASEKRFLFGLDRILASAGGKGDPSTPRGRGPSGSARTRGARRPAGRGAAPPRGG